MSKKMIPVKETLPDRMLFRVDCETYARFVELLDASPRPNARLSKLLLAKGPMGVAEQGARPRFDVEFQPRD